MPPVPKVVAWSSEHRFTVRPDPCIGGHLALFANLGGPGQGKPIYAELSHERQRAIVSGRACGICGCRLPTGSGFALLIPERPSWKLRPAATRRGSRRGSSPSSARSRGPSQKCRVVTRTAPSA